MAPALATMEKLYWRAPLSAQKLIFHCYGYLYDRQRFSKPYHSYYQEMQERQWWSAGDLQCYQEEQLRSLVRHAYETVPYYARIFRELRLHPRDIKNLTDLQKIPPLTKDIIKTHYQDLISAESKKIPHVLSRSGGSSGQPLWFLLPRDLRFPFATAALMVFYSWAGFAKGDSYATLAARHISEGNPYWRYNRAARQLYFSSRDLTNDTAGVFVEKLKDFRPKFINGHPTMIGYLAAYLLKKGEKLPLKAVFTSSETLFFQLRRDIESAFACPVFDTYGMGEQVLMAGECPVHRGMHLSPEYGVAEVVSENYLQTSGTGTILGTSLRNFVMPFIRYNTGDLGRLEAAPCSCGRQSPRLLSMEGRLDDVITGLQGEIIFPFVIRKALLKEEWIRRYQLIYHRDASISFLLEQPDPLSEDQVQRVNALLQSIFGPRGNIREIKATPLLPRTRGQKEKLIIKE